MKTWHSINQFDLRKIEFRSPHAIL